MIEHIEYQTPEMNFNLARLGYPLIQLEKADSSNFKRYSPEETIIKILAEFPDPRYIQGIPVIISKNNINYQKLFKLVSEYGKKIPNLPNTLGCFLEKSNQILREYDLKSDLTGIEKAIMQMQGMRIDEETVIDPSLDNAAYKKMAIENRDTTLAKWGLLGIYPDEKLKSIFNLYRENKKEFHEAA